MTEMTESSTSRRAPWLRSVLAVSLPMALLGTVIAQSGDVAHAVPLSRSATTGVAAAMGQVAGKAAWRPCAGNRELRCASLSVPVDWKAPNGPRVKLPVVKRMASDKRRVGTLVVNYGGPGERHAQELASGTGAFARFGKRFDLVAFDTRDTLLKCGENLVVHGDKLPIILGNRAAYDQRVRYNRALAKSCRAASGPVFGHVSAADIARDMEALRVFLKEPKLNYYGISYGTLIGQMYAERYPERLRTMVLDSVVDHSQKAPAFLAGAARAQEETVRAAARWCARATSCALHGRNAAARLKRLFTAAERGTLTEGGQPVDTSALLKRTYLGNQTEQAWPSFFQGLASYRIRKTPVKPAPLPQLPTKPGAPVHESRPTALICADWDFGPNGHKNAAALWKASRTAAPHAYGNAWYQEWAARCAGWPRPAANPQHPLRAAKIPPALLLNARHDPATSHAWATRVGGQLPGSRLLTYQGTGHAVINFGGRCVTDAVYRYLFNGKLTGVPETCPGTHRP
ncbi:hypothetical protein DMA15_36040 [Streptomyces sp. WAC 01529]|uniref:alpha/beta fold hydrolase n=1 Tax=Streptomyces sp. WAC 01529 TaxID=2203205 RepID=UPI000F6CB279|nr:alpha/beta hydrolase [Streptomyces sp. WAC 01529]AZM57304.1 hypothetical protein DMA15_36040 [Streptomyces sp. WAC 01529]